MLRHHTDAQAKPLYETSAYCNRSWVREVTRLVANSTKANVFRATHSRLVADTNRSPDEADCVAPTADGTEIPMNRALDDAGRTVRLATYFHPAIEGLKAFVADLAASADAEPLVICMHKGCLRKIRCIPKSMTSVSSGGASFHNI
jgi:hypothetical protein